MSRRRNRTPTEIAMQGSFVHDHFDGSANCVECGGNCRLTGNDLFLTMLVRNILERAALRKQDPAFDYRAEFFQAGIDFVHLWKRAQYCMRPFVEDTRAGGTTRAGAIEKG